MSILLYSIKAGLVDCAIDPLETVLQNVAERKKETYSFVAKIEKDGKQVCSCVLVDSQVALTLTSCVQG